MNTPIPFGARLRTWWIELSALLGFDVRMSRNGRCYFVLRDKRLDYRVRKKMKAQKQKAMN